MNVKKNNCAVAKCKCNHAAQDSIHGEGNRVFNRKQHKKYNGDGPFECTVCGRERTVAA